MVRARACPLSPSRLRPEASTTVPSRVLSKAPGTRDASSEPVTTPGRPPMSSGTVTLMWTSPAAACASAAASTIGTA